MEKKEFKGKLAEGIKELSEAMSCDMEPISPQILVKMIDSLYKLIVESKFELSIELYLNVIRKILLGERQIYKLNVINLMAIFRAEIMHPDILGYNESYINGKRMFNRVIEIPKGTRPCPNNLYHWSATKKDWIYGN